MPPPFYPTQRYLFRIWVSLALPALASDKETCNQVSAGVVVEGANGERTEMVVQCADDPHQ